jgi:hypothetical protein
MNKKFREELISYFSLIWLAPHRKRKRGDTQAHKKQVGLLSLLIKVKGDTQTDGDRHQGYLISFLLFFFKIKKLS